VSTIAHLPAAACTTSAPGSKSPRAANGKVEVLGKLMREGLDEKLDLWLEIWHFQIFSLEGFL